jgi:CRP/FNR family cyclic AMP-dependent transcriptional regulator
MKKPTRKMSNAIFIVTSENSCPYYDLGDELKVENGSLSISSFKPVCLYLSEKVKEIASVPDSVSGFSRLVSHQVRPNTQQVQYDCGGCTGLIQYKYKQEKDYATLQMKMLKETEEKRKRAHLEKFYNLMRSLQIFDSLEDENLKDLTLFLEFKTLLPRKVLVEKGAPGMHLYIIITGQVSVVDDTGQSISRLQSGDIFGEVSLLSGEPHPNSIHTVTATQVALLSVKNFRQILKGHPSLQIFLFKLLISRVQAVALRSGNIASGMTGDLAEVPAVDLMQLINSSQKTGTVDLVSAEDRAQVYFDEGEIVQARFNKLEGKDAVFAVLGMKKGHFTYSRGLSEELSGSPPIGGFIGLMMEGVQRIDEDSQL